MLESRYPAHQGRPPWPSLPRRPGFWEDSPGVVGAGRARRLGNRRARLGCVLARLWRHGLGGLAGGTLGLCAAWLALPALGLPPDAAVLLWAAILGTVAGACVPPPREG
jgi:hypothetical protein